MADTLYRFLVNGQTAKADGDKPVSWWKILNHRRRAMIAFALIALMMSQLLTSPQQPGLSHRRRSKADR
jgi:hypothetical protein